MTGGLRVSGGSIGAGLRLWDGSGVGLYLLVYSRMVKAVVMDGRQQLPTFQVFDRRMKFDAAASGFPTDSTDDIRGRHWPLLGKNVLRKPLRLNASKGSTLFPESPGLIGLRPVSRWFDWAHPDL
jgi:hypothetical protein